MGALGHVDMDAENIAIGGFDAVSFFSGSRPRKGRAEFSHDWNGSKWYFSSAANQELFRQSPEKYAPQFGGYCAWAVSQGYAADGDPNVWKIVNGKLYLNYNRRIKEKWEAEQRILILKAEKNWEELNMKKPG